MKNIKYLAILLMACITAALFGYKNDDGFIIRGKITGVKEGSKVVFDYADIRSMNSVPLGTAIVKNGEFEFKGKLNSSRFLSVRVNAAKNVVGTCFFADNATMTLTGSVDDLIDWSKTINGGVSTKVRITGSKSQELYSAYNQKAAVFNQAISALSSKNIAELYKEVREGLEPVKMPIEYGIKLSKEIDALAKKRKMMMMDFVLRNKPSEVSSYIALIEGRNDLLVSDIDLLIKHFSANPEKGVLMENFLKTFSKVRESAIGAKFTDFTLNDPQGKPHKLSDYAGKGRYVLLEFWASWCGHCRASFPHLKKCYELYHDKGFDVVAISLDSQVDIWTEAMKEDGTSNLWPQLSDLKAYNGDIAKVYGFSGLPASILLDPNGKIVNRSARGAWLENLLIDGLGNRFVEK